MVTFSIKHEAFAKSSFDNRSYINYTAYSQDSESCWRETSGFRCCLCGWKDTRTRRWRHREGRPCRSRRW